MKHNFIRLVAITLSICLALSGCAGGKNTKPADGQITVEAQGTIPVETRNWAPVIDEDGTYHFGVLDQEMTGKLLTDFTAGEVNLETAYGKYEFSDGIIKVRTKAQFADSYDNYKGDDLTFGDYENADYIGIRIKNNQDNEIYFGLQGVAYDGSTIMLSTGEGVDAILAYDDGRAYRAPTTYTTFRNTLTVPAKFEGSILIPVARICDTADVTKAKFWVDSGRSPFYCVGFHVTGGGTGSVEFHHMFTGAGTLPEVGALPGAISNPEYSYTDEQRLLPFWKHNIMYNECLTFEEHDGKISGTLLFVPTRIISVVDVTHKIEYKEGVDYEWVEGTNELKWLEGSTIPYYYEGALEGIAEPGGSTYVPSGTWDEQNRQRLGGVLYCVGEFYYEKQISVTYEYDLSQVESRGILYTPYQGDRLPKTLQKLENNEDLRVLVYGDSVWAGCDASGMYGRAPYLPPIDRLFTGYLQDQTTGTVSFKNLAVGGWGYQDGLAALSGPVSKNGMTKDYSSEYEGFDLLVLSFGGNNGNSTADEVTEGLQKIIDKIREKNPGIEVLLVTPGRANPDAQGFTGNKGTFGAAYQVFADEHGYAYVNMYAIHESILQYKSYSSTSGNNINHPNDWRIRIYVMNMLATMFE